MKTQFKNLKATLLVMTLILGAFASVQAQRFGATLNVGSFTSNRVNGAGSDGLAVNGSANLGVNLRYFTRSKIGFRAGVGVENLSYSVDNGLTTDFNAKRKDLKGSFGLEWHPLLGKWIDIYPGAFIPITVAGNDVLEENVSYFTGGNFTAGVGLLLGANIRVLKIFRVGVEFDTKYEAFKSAAIQSVEQGSISPIKRMNSSFNFTFGILL